MTAETIIDMDDMVSRLEGGQTQAEVAEALGVSRAVIYRRLQRMQTHGLEFSRGRPRAKIDVARIRSLLAQDLTVKHVADRLRVSAVTVRRRLREDQRGQASINAARLDRSHP